MSILSGFCIFGVYSVYVAYLWILFLLSSCPWAPFVINVISIRARYSLFEVGGGGVVISSIRLCDVRACPA